MKARWVQAQTHPLSVFFSFPSNAAAHRQVPLLQPVPPAKPDLSHFP